MHFKNSQNWFHIKWEWYRKIMIFQHCAKTASDENPLWIFLNKKYALSRLLMIFCTSSRRRRWRPPTTIFSIMLQKSKVHSSGGHVIRIEYENEIVVRITTWIVAFSALSFIVCRKKVTCSHFAPLIFKVAAASKKGRYLPYYLMAFSVKAAPILWRYRQHWRNDQFSSQIALAPLGCLW